MRCGTALSRIRKTLCTFDFMQIISLIDSFCRMRLLKFFSRPEKSHSTFKSSHSTNVKSNAIIQKKVYISVMWHSTFKMSNTISTDRTRLLISRMRHFKVAFGKLLCPIRHYQCASRLLERGNIAQTH